MAERFPSALGTAGFCPPDSVLTGVPGPMDSLIANGAVQRHLGLRLQVFPFTVANGDFWVSSIPQIRAVAWQPDSSSLHPCAPSLLSQSQGTILFEHPQGFPVTGWLWVLSGGSG